MDLMSIMTGISPEQRNKINAEINQDLIKSNKYVPGNNKEYLDIDTYRRLMNDIFGFMWSFEIIESKESKNAEGELQFVTVKGRLTVPGVGVKEQYGCAAATKKDNTQIYSIAASFAFKACCKLVGVGAAFNDETFDAPLYEEEVAPAPKKNDKKKKEEAVEDEKPAKEETKEEEEKPKKKGKKKEEEPAEEPDEEEADAWTDEKKAKVAELKNTYDIQSKEEMVAFAQIWNPKIKSISDLTPDVFMKLYDYVEENSEEFEDFDPSEVA